MLRCNELSQIWRDRAMLPWFLLWAFRRRNGGFGGGQCRLFPSVRERRWRRWRLLGGKDLKQLSHNLPRWEGHCRPTSLIDVVFWARHFFPVKHVTPGRFLRYVTTTLGHNDQFVARQVIFLDSFGNHSFWISTWVHIRSVPCVDSSIVGCFQKGKGLSRVSQWISRLHKNLLLLPRWAKAPNVWGPGSLLP